MDHTREKRPAGGRLLAGAALLAALAVGAAGFFYARRRVQKAAARDAVAVAFASELTLSVGGVALPVSDYSLTASAPFGSGSVSAEAAGPKNLPAASFAADDLMLPAELTDARVAVSHDGEQVFSGSAVDFAAFIPAENGLYECAVSGDVSGGGDSAMGDAVSVSGTARWAFTLDYEVETAFSLSAETLPQGDALLLRGTGVRGEVSVELSASDAGASPVALRENGEAVSLIGVSYRCPPGSYTCTVTAGAQSFELPFFVTEQKYEKQELTISTETQQSTVGDAEAVAAYNKMLEDTLAHDTETCYFTGPFTRPVEGKVTTAFGLYRYTNGSSYPSRHVGVDIAAAEGTPVLAASAGEVIFAGFIGTSGNTVCIDHGMGVHSYYYHMQALSVSAGDLVQQGAEVGKVGETGYATGPHLHFNITVSGVSVDPWQLIDGSSGVFALLG